MKAYALIVIHFVEQNFTYMYVRWVKSSSCNLIVIVIYSKD